MRIAEEKTKDYEGLRIMRAKQAENGWVLKYITLSNEYPIAEIANAISAAAGFEICLEKLNYSFEICAIILFKGDAVR